VSGAGADQLTATHVFNSDGNDVPVAKVYRVMPHLTVAGGVRRCVPFSLQVLE
jgi:hypothetical protein